MEKAETHLEDAHWMRRAIALARRSEGHTAPNPPVGAVIVKDGLKLGEGRHLYAGGHHAEVEAFEQARGRARGATLYVTLEPCSTQGRTPPCTTRIIAEGIARVVVGCVDENRRHAGAGLLQLQRHGIEVLAGVQERACRKLAAPFFKHLASGMPFVTLKLGLTLDGCIADRRKSSQWITGAAARQEVQHMRRRADAVMVGSGTVVADDPSLLCRLRGSGRLWRVVVDGTARTPLGARILTDAAARSTIIATLDDTVRRHGAAWEGLGARVWPFKPDSSGRVPLAQVLRRLGELGCLHLLCEGGGGLAGALHEAGLIDEYALFYAPKVLGDTAAVRGFAGRGVLLEAVSELRLLESRRFGADVLLRLAPPQGDAEAGFRASCP